MAPLERRAQRLLARRAGTASRTKKTEPVVEPLRDRRRAEGSDPAGCELERERQPVEAKADSRDVVRVLLVEREPRRGGGRALDEERHGLVLAKLSRRESLLRVGNVERRNAKDDLAGHAQRLAARRDDRHLRRSAQQRVDSDAVAASTCSQLSRTRSTLRGARNPITASTRSCPAALAGRARRRPRPGSAADRSARRARPTRRPPRTPARRLGRARGRAASSRCRPYRKE